MAFLYLTYGILCDSESWGSWIFSSSFETERQPGRMLAEGRSSREVGRGTWVKLSSGAVREQAISGGSKRRAHTEQPSHEGRIERWSAHAHSL